MNEAEPRRSVMPKFSLLNLLALTALIAIGTAVGLAYRKNVAMIQERDELLSLSSRLQIDDVDKLAASEMPKVANDFQSWNVHIPNGQDYDLRLGIGAVFERGIPPIAGSVRLLAGRHRVTLYAGDSPNEQFRYVVYVDGEQVIEKSMGSDWISGGWSSASGISWPRESELSPAPLQLTARTYQPKIDFGSGNYFNGNSDNYVTRKGYRLWIDQPNRTYDPPSPFIGFADDPRHLGIGLRDGLRYLLYSLSPYNWSFTRPNLNTSAAVLRVSAEFFSSEGTILSSQTQSFQAWYLTNDAAGKDALKWQPDQAHSGYSAFLHAKLKSDDTPQPVVEMKWEADRPDAVGLRIADTDANNQVSGWRLRIHGGTQHLWRELQIGEKTVDLDQAINKREASEPFDAALSFDLENTPTTDTRLQWQTNEPMPLQVLERRQNRYSGMGLYRGLPVTFGIEIPALLNPALTVIVVQKAPDSPDKAFPGGTVFDELQIDLEAVGHEWIWIRAKSKE